MTEEKKVTRGVDRIFEQPPDAVSFYSDIAQVVSTGNEVVLQFYETIPGPPEKEGQISRVRSRLRATITVSLQHAKNIGKLIMERTGEGKK